jgi:hypothetical protein
MSIEFSPNPGRGGHLVTATATYDGSVTDIHIFMAASGATNDSYRGIGPSLGWDIWLDRNAQGTLYLTVRYSQDGSVIFTETGQVEILKHD